MNGQGSGFNEVNDSELDKVSGGQEMLKGENGSQASGETAYCPQCGKNVAFIRYSGGRAKCANNSEHILFV